MRTLSRGIERFVHLLRRGHEDELCPRILQEVRDLGYCQRGVHRDVDDSSTQAAIVGYRPLGSVLCQDRRAVAARNPVDLEGSGHVLRLREHLLVRMALKLTGAPHIPLAVTLHALK